MMCWKGLLLYDSEAELRQWWVRSKLEEEGCLSKPISSSNQYRFLPLPCFECDVEGLEQAYTRDFAFKRDGLLFVSKQWRYDEGVTPAVLVWKDQATSSFMRNLAPTPEGPARVPVTLCLHDDLTLRTREDVVVGTVPMDFALQRKMKPGDLLRFTITDACETDGNTPTVAGTKYEGRASKRRLFADVWSKLQFNFAPLHTPVTISVLALAARPSCVGVGGGGAVINATGVEEVGAGAIDDDDDTGMAPGTASDVPGAPAAVTPPAAAVAGYGVAAAVDDDVDLAM